MTFTQMGALDSQGMMLVNFLNEYVEKGIFEKDPFQEIDRAGVGKLMEISHRIW